MPDLSTARVTLLVAHGSRNPLAAAAHERLCEAVAASSSGVRPGTSLSAFSRMKLV